MNKSIFILSLSNFVAGMLGISCKSDSETEAKTDDVEITQEAVRQAKEDEMLEEMQAKKIAYSDSVEWEAYKKETETKIKTNEKRIQDLKLEIKKATKKYDDAYLSHVDQIEKKNAELNFKIDSYTVSTDNDWEDFKTELNNELEKLGKSIDYATKKIKK